jgi:hypothetical protein
MFDGVYVPEAEAKQKAEPQRLSRPAQFVRRYLTRADLEAGLDEQPHQLNEWAARVKRKPARFDGAEPTRAELMAAFERAMSGRIGC